MLLLSILLYNYKMTTVTLSAHARRGPRVNNMSPYVDALGNKTIPT